MSSLTWFSISARSSAVGRMLQVVLEVAAGAVELPQLHAKQTAIAELVEVFGIDDQHHVDDRKAFVDRHGPSHKSSFRLFSIRQRICRFVTRARRRSVEFERRRRNVLARRSRQSSAGEDLSTVERIEKELFTLIRILHEEVTRHADAGNREIQTLATSI